MLLCFGLIETNLTRWTVFRQCTQGCSEMKNGGTKRRASGKKICKSRSENVPYTSAFKLSPRSHSHNNPVHHDSRSSSESCRLYDSQSSSAFLSIRA